MKFKCCEMLMNHLVFAPTKVMPCCCSPTGQYDITFYNDYEGAFFELEEYISKRNAYIDTFKENKIPKCCLGCSFIEEKEWDESICFTNIIITNHTKCSCKCIYCSLLENDPDKKNELNSRTPYDIKPALTDMKNKNLIKSGCSFMIAGGECTEYPNKELDWLLDYAASLKCKTEILSSGIIFSKAIEKTLKHETAVLRISPDTGIKKTYEKIKQIKAFDKTWKNIKKYINASKNNPNAYVELKYILLPGINDNMPEAQEFIKKAKSVNCKAINISVEYNWFYANKNNKIEKNMQDVINYFVNISKNNNPDFKLNFEPQVETWFEENARN